MLIARKAVKRLYALLHVKPGERAQKILFEEDPPADSRVFALKELARAATPVDQARAIIEHRIPYRVAVTVVQQMTPTVLLAIIESMSPQELINNLGSLQRRGAMDNPDLKALIELKLEDAQTSRRVSAFKAEEAMKAAPLSQEVRQKLERVADAQVKAKGRIMRPTALLIDKSGSMELAIELGKQLGAMISAVCEKDLFVYAFDTMAYPIELASGGRQPPDDLAAWEKALQGITAGGGTSCGVALEYMLRKQQYVEQLIVVTDEGENTAPLFLDSLKKYREAVKADPTVCFVKTPHAGNQLEVACQPGRCVVRCVPVHGRLLRAAEPGAIAVAAVEAGIAHGNHGLPTSHAEAGVVTSTNRGLLPDRKSVQTIYSGGSSARTPETGSFSSWNLQRTPVFSFVPHERAGWLFLLLNKRH